MTKDEYQFKMQSIQELKQGQDNFNKLWDMYSELKKENKELKSLLPTDIDTTNVWTWKKKDNNERI